MSDEEIAVPVSMGGWVRFGLTKREYFAAMAMQGVLSSWPENARIDIGDTGKVSVEFADALLAALEESSDD